MKIIELNRNNFDTLYDILTEYLNTKTSSDDCIAKAFEYVKKYNLLKIQHEEFPFGEGFRLIHRYPPGFNAFRSIYVSPHEPKLFYEGVLPMRYADELKYADYMSFDRREIEMICKKYKLAPVIDDNGTKIIVKINQSVAAVYDEQGCLECVKNLDTKEYMMIEIKMKGCGYEIKRDSFMMDNYQTNFCDARYVRIMEIDTFVPRLIIIPNKK